MDELLIAWIRSRELSLQKNIYTQSKSLLLNKPADKEIDRAKIKTALKNDFQTSEAGAVVSTMFLLLNAKFVVWSSNESWSGA